jgi:hypothetical protein
MFALRQTDEKKTRQALPAGFEFLPATTKRQIITTGCF